MAEDDRVWDVKALLFDYVKSPSLRHIREPHFISKLAQEFVKRVDRGKVDFKTRNKWARLLRYAKVFKDPAESLIDFVRRRGGINRCVRRYSRQLGRAGRICT